MTALFTEAQQERLVRLQGAADDIEIVTWLDAAAEHRFTLRYYVKSVDGKILEKMFWRDSSDIEKILDFIEEVERGPGLRGAIAHLEEKRKIAIQKEQARARARQAEEEERRARWARKQAGELCRHDECEAVPIAESRYCEPHQHHDHQCVGRYNSGRRCQRFRTIEGWCLFHHPDRERLMRCGRCGGKMHPGTAVKRHRQQARDGEAKAPRYCGGCMKRWIGIQMARDQAAKPPECLMCSRVARLDDLVCSGRCGRMLAGELVTAGFLEMRIGEDDAPDPQAA